MLRRTCYFATPAHYYHLHIAATHAIAADADDTLMHQHEARCRRCLMPPPMPSRYAAPLMLMPSMFRHDIAFTRRRSGLFSLRRRQRLRHATP